MKWYATFLFVSVWSFQLLMAQSRPYNVVFDLTSSDTLDHKAVLRWVNEILRSNPDAKLEIVLYGQSLNMVVKDQSVVTTSLNELLSSKNNLGVKVCAAAMKRHNIDKSQLLPNVDIVPDGIFEIVSKQRDGWGYIKVSH